MYLVCVCEFSLDMRCPSSLYFCLFSVFLHLPPPLFPQGEKMSSLTHSHVYSCPAQLVCSESILVREKTRAILY